MPFFSPGTEDQLMQQRKIRSVVIQTARRVRPEDLKAFIEENLTD